MFTITIHLQATDLHLLEPLARHLGHIEVAIDSPLDLDDANLADRPEAPRITREIHPAVKMIDKLEHERERKQRERDRQRVESPKVIDAADCPTCLAVKGRPCRSTTGKKIAFGRTGHTHYERRMAAQS